MGLPEGGGVAVLTEDEMDWDVVVIISGGGSGCGKGTIINRLMSALSLLLGGRATTRLPRTTDMDGEYECMEPSRFELLWNNHGLLECDGHFDVWYGLKRPDRGARVITDIDVRGSMRLHDAGFPRIIRIGILPPGETLDEKIAVCRARMIARGDTSEQDIVMRLDRAPFEIDKIENEWSKDPNALVVVNDNLDVAVATIAAHVRRKMAAMGLMDPNLAQLLTALDDIALELGQKPLDSVWKIITVANRGNFLERNLSRMVNEPCSFDPVGHSSLVVPATVAEVVHKHLGDPDSEPQLYGKEGAKISAPPWLRQLFSDLRLKDERLFPEVFNLRD